MEVTCIFSGPEIFIFKSHRASHGEKDPKKLSFPELGLFTHKGPHNLMLIIAVLIEILIMFYFLQCVFFYFLSKVILLMNLLSLKERGTARRIKFHW